MSYQTPITIRETIEKIQTRQLVLPAIQREFVWGAWQIEHLFDSLLRGYPISTFLFWHVKAEQVGNFQWYDFLRTYHERDHRHNDKLVLPVGQPATAVLDGQQRLTSLYLSLCGSFAKKLSNKQWNNDAAFPKKKLYVNLLAPAPEGSEKTYDFRLLTTNEAAQKEVKGVPCYWFKVGEVLPMQESSGPFDYLFEQGLLDSSKYPKEQGQHAKNTLIKLHNAVHTDKVVAYYEEKGEELDKVLQIFIRINSGGTKLSYSDLLLSIATAEWKQGSARELIHGFVDELNGIGNGFRFDKDFVLKSCLVLADLHDIRFRVDNFTSSNMEVIQERWSKITRALHVAVELASEFGYAGESLTSTNALIPIAYFLLHNNFSETILAAPAREADRMALRQWLARVLLKRTFGGQPDGLYPVLRRLIQEHAGSFPLAAIVEHYRGKRKSILFTVDEIDNLLEMQYGQTSMLSTLTLLYMKRLNSTFRYHQDHLHPKSRVRNEDLIAAGITDAAQIQQIQQRMNRLPNLQLLEAGANIGKSNISLSEWLAKKADQRAAYELQHFMPGESTDEPKVSADLSGFISYYDARRKLMRQELAAVLGVELTEPTMVDAEADVVTAPSI